MSQQQVDRLRECKDGMKRVIAQMEATVGVEAALPVTMPLLAAIEETERLCRA